jgi:hypothetical protein
MATNLRIAKSATELRIVLGQLVRLLSAQHAFPFNQATVLTRLEREGAMTTAALAAAERVRSQSMAHTVSSYTLEASSPVSPTRAIADKS